MPLRRLELLLKLRLELLVPRLESFPHSPRHRNTSPPPVATLLHLLVPQLVLVPLSEWLSVLSAP